MHSPLLSVREGTVGGRRQAASGVSLSATYADFLRGLWDDPKAVSAPTPSGKRLARAIAAEVDPASPGLVIELGAGTGTVTSALIARGIREEKLVLFESVPRFQALLSRRFPRATILCADAFRFDRYLPESAKVAAVVSGIPLLNHPLAERAQLIERSLDRQGPGASFIQLSYGWWPPIPAGPGMRLSRRVILRNMPPAHIWIYRRPS
jgi:phosphatidylethanolamine/phosphatidyl-N-methylethanolamine N-methyltransferase